MIIRMIYNLKIEINEKIENIKETSKQAFRALNLGGVCRIDYLIDKKTNKYYINEPNTIPGSLAFYLWEKTEVKKETAEKVYKDYCK